MKGIGKTCHWCGGLVLYWRDLATLGYKAEQYHLHGDCWRAIGRPTARRYSELTMENAWRAHKAAVADQVDNAPASARGHVGTASGRLVPLWDTPASLVHVQDLAASLARVPRFHGQTLMHYTVAQHSVLVAELVPAELKAAALLHDAHEAYTGDFPRPIKQELKDQAVLLDRLANALLQLGRLYGRQMPADRHQDLHDLVQQAMVASGRTLPAIEDNLNQAIAARFGIDPAMLEAPEIKAADLRLLATEHRDLRPLLPNHDHLPAPLATPIVPVDEMTARHQWLQALAETGVVAAG